MEFDYIGIIQTIGFPIAIVIWFMLRTEKVINNNTSTLTKIAEVMSSCKLKQQSL